MVTSLIAIVLAAPGGALATLELVGRCHRLRPAQRSPHAKGAAYAREMLSLSGRVEDARCLWRADHREGALLMALIAVAARARQEFPSPHRDRDAFEMFVRLKLQPRISVEFRGRVEPIERLLYKWMRCELVHNGHLPVDIQLGPDDGRPGLVVRAGGAPAYTVFLSPSWFEELLAWATV